MSSSNPMLIVLDTNVLVSALLTPFGNAARILDMVILGQLKVIYDDRIISEYREVLLRPKFHFVKKDVDALLTFIEDEGFKVTSSPLRELQMDKGDIPFIEAALAGMAETLITGNKRHFKGKYTKKIKIMNPDKCFDTSSALHL